MPISTDKRPQNATIIFTVIDPLTIPDDQIQQLQETVQFKQAVGKHIYRIMDFSTAQIDFGMLVAGMANERGVPGGSNDPEVTTYFVGSDSMVQLGVKALQDYEHLYGKTDVRLATSVDEALADIQARPHSA